MSRRTYSVISAFRPAIASHLPRCSTGTAALSHSHVRVDVPQLVTITVTSHGASYSISVIVDGPADPADSHSRRGHQAGLPETQPSGKPDGRSVFQTRPWSWRSRAPKRHIVTSDLSCHAHGGVRSSGATLSNTCSGIEYEGVVTFSNCSPHAGRDRYSITASEVRPLTAYELTPATTGTFNSRRSSFTVRLHPVPVSGRGSKSATMRTDHRARAGRLRQTWCPQPVDRPRLSILPARPQLHLQLGDDRSAWHGVSTISNLAVARRAPTR